MGFFKWLFGTKKSNNKETFGARKEASSMQKIKGADLAQEKGTDPTQEIERLKEAILSYSDINSFILEIETIGFRNFQHSALGTTCESDNGSFVFFIGRSSNEFKNATYLNKITNETINLLSQTKISDGEIDHLDNFFAYGWDSQDKAMEAFEILRKSKLGGPGLVELREIESMYYVVTKNIIVGTSTSLENVYGIPYVDFTESWFPYEGNRKLESVTNNDNLIDSFWVEAQKETLLFARENFGEQYYCCNTSSGDIKNSVEIENRIKDL